MAVDGNRILNKQDKLTGMYTNISYRLKSRHIVDSLYLDDMHIQLYDDVAIVTFLSDTQRQN